MLLGSVAECSASAADDWTSELLEPHTQLLVLWTANPEPRAVFGAVHAPGAAAEKGRPAGRGAGPGAPGGAGAPGPGMGADRAHLSELLTYASPALVILLLAGCLLRACLRCAACKRHCQGLGAGGGAASSAAEPSHAGTVEGLGSW